MIKFQSMPCFMKLILYSFSVSKIKKFIKMRVTIWSWLPYSDCDPIPDPQSSSLKLAWITIQVLQVRFKTLVNCPPTVSSCFLTFNIITRNLQMFMNQFNFLPLFLFTCLSLKTVAKRFNNRICLCQNHFTFMGQSIVFYLG